MPGRTNAKGVDALLAWIGFFQDIGVSDLPRVSRRGETLRAIREDLGECKRCKLSTTRRHIVFGVGPEDAELVFVGEAPGENEDAQGEPFVGRAGDLLNRMIAAMGYRREQVYIANVIKCRPPGNRNPEPDEIAACRPFLERQLAGIQPKAIVALGAFASQLLTGSTERISQLRGRFHQWRGFKVMPTFHPSYLLQSPSKKKESWADLQVVMKLLGKPIPAAQKKEEREPHANFQ